MINLGLAGHAGSGKDTVADYLVKHYGFIKYSFSDALYREVAAAYSLPDESLLRDRATKDRRTERLCLLNCLSDEFIGVANEILGERHLRFGGITLPINVQARSPREILQLWGTEYRRAQNPDYWVIKARGWLFEMTHYATYPEHAPQFFVNSSVRFENERVFMHQKSHGNVWHIRREGVGAVNSHVSDMALPVLPGERELFNNDTITRLHQGIDLLMKTSAQFVRVEPMLPRNEAGGVIYPALKPYFELAREPYDDVTIAARHEADAARDYDGYEAAAQYYGAEAEARAAQAAAEGYNAVHDEPAEGYNAVHDEPADFATVTEIADAVYADFQKAQEAPLTEDDTESEFHYAKGH